MKSQSRWLLGVGVLLGMVQLLHAQDPRKELATESTKSQSWVRHLEGGASVELQFDATGNAKFVVSGLPTSTISVEPKELFWVEVASAESDPPKLLGSYQRRDKDIVFTPRFQLSRKLKFKVRFTSQLSDKLAREQVVFEMPAADSKSTAQVAAVYPSADSLPNNVLKFYIHFSEPMSRGEAYERIRLRHNGQEVPRPFLELGEELWDGEQKRFTLFMHPGRIKRGLKPRMVDGPAISEGNEYTLEISAQWQSAKGLPLVSSYEKRFTVVSADHQQPNLENWKIETPHQDTRQPLVLELNEPLDHAMLGRVLTVMDREGNLITGEISIGESETRWSFQPDLPWKVGIYQVEVAANLEDLCGNSIARPFEVKMQENAAANPATKVAIEFVVK